ncbi:chondroitin sulfate proteoglycan 4 [Schistocerca americana]|uniref:chondroitin sulfate proteoglycan 4 n=1 Tax=Schistocerca americana TaxID=7009 RepID=UPI001F4F5EEC|nr:chondroitin sulfate proteoglycan 4 [Schistocerca americana]
MRGERERGGGASFYGASYIAVPLQDARSTTELEMRFRTRRADAMLFLAAGRIDYCLVILETGRLKVRINVGDGEREISSPKGLRLDDLQWHDVLISRRDAAFSLTIDTIHVVTEKLPGRFFELNVHFGLFVGSQGDFSELFLGHLENLRGCLADVRYNGVDVLRRARERHGHVDVHGVTWTCAPEFDAASDRDISFVENDAFLALPNLISRTGVRWRMDVKTASPLGLLVYNAGLTTQSDFVALELVDGRPRLLLNKGNGPTELQSDVAVADGAWHTLAVHFNPTFMEVSVDGAVSSLRLPPGGSRFFDLADTVFVGGTEVNKRARARTQGVRSATASFRGCVRNMWAEQRRVGFPEARVTHGVLPDCVWTFACAARQPCVPSARCHQHGVDSFRCSDCGQPMCVKPDYAESYKVFSKPTLPVDLEILVLTPLQVAEGGSAPVTTRNVDVVLDFPKYGVRDTGVLFFVVEPPRHGRLEVDRQPHGQGQQSQSPAQAPLAFTLLDMTKDKVRYTHDGSEQHQDAVSLEVELSPDAEFTLPGYLQGRHRFALHVNVTPVNDPPLLFLPPGKTLRLAQGTRKVLTRSLLRAEDPDSPPEELVFTVLSRDAAGGHVERALQPGRPLDSFTQRDLDAGLVAYAHPPASASPGAPAGAQSRLALQVSDGIETSAAAVLRIAAYPLQLTLINNTGLVITHRTWARLQPGNLSFAVNADDPSLDVRYEVVRPPQFGHVQRQRGAGADGTSSTPPQWVNVDHFTNHQLARGIVRYVHTEGAPAHDDFKFKVSVLDVESPKTYDFRVTFTELQLVAERAHELLLNGSRDALLTDAQLSFRTAPLPTDAAQVQYRLTAAPRYGALHLQGSPPHQHLQLADTFTQLDLRAGRLRYRLHRKAYSHVRDEIRFRVTAPGCEPLMGSLSLVHVPSVKTRAEVRATLERLQVTEGGREPVLRTHLDLETAGITQLLYNVTHGPRHGRLDVMDVGMVQTLREGTNWFSSRELLTERVFYVHDDSETRRDSFHFVALSSEEEDFQYVGVFHVDVLLRNDNTPVRAVDKVFRVVTGGERLLTGDDLRYSDADIDTKPSDILYTRRGIPNGGIFQAASPNEALFEFTQEDLDKRRVLFRHEGDEYGKVGLWITDGQFYANGILEVRASPPFVEIVNNTGVIVKQGGGVVISTWNLSAETNLNVWGEQISYEVTEGPSHGQLVVGREGAASRFSQLDVERGALLYKHDASDYYSDRVAFRVDAGGRASADGQLLVRVFPAAYWEPLVVAANRTLLVEESTSVVVSSDVLKVMHPQIPPTDIVFTVVEPPAYGYLELEPPSLSAQPSWNASEEAGALPGSLSEFDQATVDEGRLLYVQAAANRSRDHVTLDVGNGVRWLRGLRLQLVVVPERLYLAPAAAAQAVTEFRVARPPRAGRLRLAPASPKGGPSAPTLLRFTTAQLQAGLVQYEHDGSETLSDDLVVVGVAGEKRSEPATVRVHVAPVNDEPPTLVNNTGLVVWDGASAVITPAHLAATDADTSAANLTFIVSSPRAGHVALYAAPSLHVRKFTQAQLDSHQIIFVHSGGSVPAGFEVSVSDGARTAGPFNVTARVRAVSLRVAASGALHVFPQRRAALSPQQLLATASDWQAPRPRHVVYAVSRQPQLGRLLFVSGAQGAQRQLQLADNFTQRDVNESRVWYENTHKFFGLSTNDSFAVDIRADFAESILGHVVDVDISVSSGGLEQFLPLPTLQVEEGGSAQVRINTSGVAAFLDSRAEVEVACLLLDLAAPLQHGQLIISGSDNETIFTQSEMDAGEVVYQHDGSDTLSDEVRFSLRLEPGSVLLLNATLPVAVAPVNDEPFRLVTPAPHATVVQGQARALSRELLLTEDDDTPPAQLVYEVISGPSAGRLVNAANASLGAANETVVRFTQADIDAGNLIYEHSGPLQPATFYFRVWDGRFNPNYTVFTFHVLPLTLNVSLGRPVALQQASSVALLTADHLVVSTNGRPEDVRYNVTRPPRHGAVYVHDSPAREFSQADLDAKRVMFMQSDMTAESDAFQLRAWLPDGASGAPAVVVDGIDVEVSVEPLVRIGNFTPTAGAKNRLGLHALDATPLAKLTNSNPTYLVERRPRLGRIKKIIRSSGEKRKEREREVKQFSHEEVESGVIYYVARALPRLEPGGAEDAFQFVLRASIFQPARGELRFFVRPEMAAGVVSDAASDVGAAVQSTRGPPQPLPGPKSPVSRESEQSSGTVMSSDYVLIVSMVLGVVVVSVLVAVVVKCRSSRARAAASGRAVQSKVDLSAPPPLPRPPPDDLLPPAPASPSGLQRGGISAKRFAANGSPTPLGSGLPPPSVLQCKVIPLEPVESVAGSDGELNARYPYGVADEPTEEWSSYDASEIAYPPRTNNPMLRRNQYWV